MSTDHVARDETGRPVYDPDDRAYTQPVTAADSGDPVYTTPVTTGDLPHGDALVAEKQRFGGVKVGSAFFGWLTAFGAVVFLTALVGAIGAAFGLETGTTIDEAADVASENPDVVGVVGAVALAVLLFVGYLAGGYVAGRMARFSGALQGVAVWLWGIVIAVVIALLTMFAGSRWDILGRAPGFPRFPVTEDTATTAGIVTAVVAALITLPGAILGGILGMRYHRRVDQVGLDEEVVTTDGRTRRIT